MIVGTNDGRSYYDSLQVTLRRSAGGLKFNGSYTWSKAIDTVSAEAAGFGGLSIPIDSFNVRLNRGLAAHDRTHVLNGSLIYSLPFGRGRKVGAAWPRKRIVS